MACGGKLNAAALFCIRSGVKNPFHGVDDINSESLNLLLLRGNLLRRLRINREKSVTIAQQHFSIIAENAKRHFRTVLREFITEFTGNLD